MIRRFRILAHLMMAVILAGCGTTHMQPRLVEGFDLGRGPNGELCRAERVYGEKSVGDLDGAYSVKCRGWTDTDAVGRLYEINNGADARTQLEAGQTDRLICGDPLAFAPDSRSRGTVRRCIDRTSGYRALAVTLTQGGRLFVGETFEQFQDNLVSGVVRLTGVAQLPDIKSLPEVAMTQQLADIAPAAGNAADISQAMMERRRGEALGYNLRAQYNEARDIITRYYAQLPPGATTSERIDYLLELALSESNLGYHDVALAYLDQAADLIAKTPALAADRNDILNKKLLVYQAITALNRRDFVAASNSAVQALTSTSDDDRGAPSVMQVNALPLADPDVIRRMNGGGRESRLGGSFDMSAVRLNILQAQALYVHGAAFRALGNAAAAAIELDKAETILRQIQHSGLEISNLQWLISSVAAERARVAVSVGDRGTADREFQQAVDGLSRLSLYADSPLLAQRHISYAAFREDIGDHAGAQLHYRAAMKILITAGPSAGGGITGMDDYLSSLARTIAVGGEGAQDARTEFFLASQFVAPPAVAAQIAQIQKVFEAGSGPAATRAKALQDLDREARTLDTRIASLPVDADADRAKLTRDKADILAKAAQLRGELAADSQYQQATDAVVTLAELQKALRPDEVYFRLVALPAKSFGMVITARDVAIYPLPGAGGELADLVAKVRKSIDGPRALVFDVAGAHAIYQTLFGPADGMVRAAKSIIFEPSGPLGQLPLGVLVDSQDSVDWFARNVRKNSRDYTQVSFLARQKEISNTISVRAFLIARSQSASAAAKAFIGFGNHAPPVGAALDRFPAADTELGSRCRLKAAELKEAFVHLSPLGETDLKVAERALGGGRLIERAEFTDRDVMAMGAADSGGDKLAQYSVVYFATHGLKEGELGCDNPPALVTSIGSGVSSDGLLSFREIANLHLDANLVVLSACNTAAQATVGQARNAGFRSDSADAAATLNGLVRAFLVAGSRSVLTTHWAIPIQVTVKDYGRIEPSAMLMERFFKDGATLPVADALRHAQAAMIDNVPTSNPYYWGAFALVGDGARSMLEHQPKAASLPAAGRLN